MKEAQMRDLIASCPNEFFSEDLELVGTEVSLGGKRADVVFDDKFGRRLIVEVQKGTLSRGKSGQLAEYWGRMKMERASQFIELILIANNIPSERRLFLEHIGISCKEIPIQRFQDVASKHGLGVESIATNSSTSSGPLPGSQPVEQQESPAGKFREVGYYDQVGIKPINKTFRKAALKIRDMRSGLNKNKTEGTYLVDLIRECALEITRALDLGYLSGCLFKEMEFVNFMSDLPQENLLSMRQQEERFDRPKIPQTLGEDFIKVSHRVRGNSRQDVARNIELIHLPLESVIERALTNLRHQIGYFDV